MNRIRRTIPIRLLASLLAAVLVAGSVSAQEEPAAPGVGDAATELPPVTVTFWSDLPSNGGEIVAETALGSVDEVADEVDGARYAVLEIDGRAYAFPVHAAGMAEGEVRLSVRGHASEGASTTSTHAGTAGQAPIEGVARTLDYGVTGGGDVFLAARREDGAYVVTHIVPRADVTEASTVDVHEEHVVVALHDGTATILQPQGEADSFGGLTVETTEGPRNVLEAGIWHGTLRGDGGRDAGGDAAAGSEPEVDVGIGIGFSGR